MIGGSLLPIGDDDSGVQRPHLIVAALVLANLAAFVYEITRTDLELTRLVLAWGATPLEITRMTDLPPEIGPPVVVTLLTSMFLHGGFLHIGANMLFLWIFGDNIEDAMGHVRFLLFYLICGVAGGMTEILFDRSSVVPIIGASGAISGVMGAYIVLFPRGLIRVATLFIIIPLIFRLPAIVVIGLWFLIQAMSGYASLNMETIQGGTAFFAHIGGFVAGVVLVWFFADSAAVRRQNSARRRARPGN
ncbi:MAG: rhomboid family intramembrane serine protease [Thermomicrobiales bacterium]